MTTDSLDIEHPGELEAYLLQTGRVGPEEKIAVLPLAGGVSNRTVLVRRPCGEDWVVKQALPKLRVATDWFSDPSRVEREAVGMRWLAELAPRRSIPHLIFEDPGFHLLAMEAVPTPHENWKHLLLAGQIDLNRVRQFAWLLGTIHRRAWQRRDEIALVFAERRFFESLRLEPYYAFTATQVPAAAAAFLQILTDQTRRIGDTLVHGDYSPKNILLRGPEMVLLDHEVIHWGDPAFDVGFSMAHFLSKAHRLAGARRALADACRRYWREYVQAIGPVGWLDGLERRAVRHTLACLQARVAGRSPLEYLDDMLRIRQREAVLPLMGHPVSTVDDLIDSFLSRV
jgi:aminoglycoside phosphotransferase (APT) family kinase protein